jgi:hypothetical protein
MREKSLNNRAVFALIRIIERQMSLNKREITPAMPLPRRVCAPIAGQNILIVSFIYSERDLHMETAAQNPNCSLTPNMTPLPGIVAGAQILTMRGYAAIETLRPGDRLITRRGARELREISSETRAFRPVRIGPNTLGFSRPKSEMLVAPGQEIMVRDWRAQMLFGQDSVIMPIARLVDGEFIAQDAQIANYKTFELKFDTNEVLYADGVEVMSGCVEMAETDDAASRAG